MSTKINSMTAGEGLNQLSAEDKKFYIRTLIERLLPELFLYNDAMKKKLPKNSGRTTNWRKFNSLPAVTTPLTEGKTPDGKDLDVTQIEAIIQQYGDYVMTTDMLQMTGIDPVVTEASELCGEQAALSVELALAEKLFSGTNVMFAGSKTSRTALVAGDVITGNDVKKIRRQLKKKNARKFKDGYFHAIIDPDMTYDLTNDPAWQDVAKYATPDQMLKGEIGKMHGFRFMEATAFEPVEGASELPVHRALFYGKDSYGAVDLENGGGKPDIIVKQLGSAGTDDPLNQRGSVGWKLPFTCEILQPDALISYECAVTE